MSLKYEQEVWTSVNVARFERLVKAAGLNLLTKWMPRFGVSLRYPTKLVAEYGTVQSLRIQTGAIVFSSQQAFESSTDQQCREAIIEMHRRLLQAAKTKQGDVEPSGMVLVKTDPPVIPEKAVVNYPAH